MDTANYEASLSDQQREVLSAAKEHFGDSFDVESTIGYQDWLHKLHPEPRLQAAPRRRKKRKLKIKDQ